MKFTATQWDTAENKEKFVNHFKQFVKKDFPESMFNKSFYNRMSMMRGHIAHYDRGGFWHTWFDTSERRADFLKHWASNPAYGDPEWTWSDVEKVIQIWLKENPQYEQKQRGQHEAIIEDIERKEFARLSAKYR